MRKLKTEILENRKISEGYFILSLKSPHLARETSPGQFVNIKCSESTVPLLRRPFGVHRIEKQGITVLYKLVGAGTRALSMRAKGEMLDVIGPLGRGFEVLTKTPILVAGGHGIAPLYALAETLIKEKKNKKVSLFIGARTKTHIISEDMFHTLGVKVNIATDDGSMGFKGSVAALLSNKIQALGIKGKQAQPNRRSNKRKASNPEIVIYACGPKPMLKAVREMANKRKIPCQVSMEEYMACGTGICMGCAIETRSGKKLVCKDGPVFDAEEVVL